MKKLIVSQFLFGMLLLLFAFFSCNKNSDVSLHEVHSNQKTDYLKLQTPKELNDLIDKVAKMSDEEYAKWKNRSGLKRTLYDRFAETESKILASNGTSVSVEDSSFFYIKNEQLRSKNGILLDKILNPIGIIQVGEFIIRYANGKVSFITEEQLRSYNAKRSVFNNIGDFMSLHATFLAIIPDHQVSPTTSNTQSFDFTLYTYRQDEGSKRRRWVNVKESYIITPIAVNGNFVSWSTTYRFYLEFTQQKRGLLTWNVYAVASSGYYSFYDYIPNWNYYPGGLTDRGTEMFYMVGTDGTTYNPVPPSRIDPVNGRTNTAFSFETAWANHPTYTIYRTNITENIVTENNLGNPIILKTPQMYMFISWRVSDQISGYNQTWYINQ